MNADTILTQTLTRWTVPRQYARADFLVNTMREGIHEEISAAEDIASSHKILESRI